MEFNIKKIRNKKLKTLLFIMMAMNTEILQAMEHDYENDKARANYSFGTSRRAAVDSNKANTEELKYEESKGPTFSVGIGPIRFINADWGTKTSYSTKQTNSKKDVGFEEKTAFLNGTPYQNNRIQPPYSTNLVSNVDDEMLMAIELSNESYRKEEEKRCLQQALLRMENADRDTQEAISRSFHTR